MTEYEVHEIIFKQACRDIEQYAEKIKKGQSPTVQDYDMLDKLYHLKKDMVTCLEKENAGGFEGFGPNEESMSEYSGRRGRAANGQYVSRAMSNRQSYDEGYSRGYQDAQGQSGHWQMPPYYPRNW